VLALAVALVAAPAASAGPTPGQRYDGHSATGDRVFLSVRKDGVRLDQYFVQVRTRCTDGRRRPQGLFQTGERPVRIDGAGGFFHRSPAYRGAYRTRSGPVRGRLRLSFSGTFDAAGDTVTGTIVATFRSRRFDCSGGPVAFTAHRDGTPNAPWRDPVMATGLYTAAGEGVTARLRTLAPGREAVRASIGYRVRCRSGGRLSYGHLFRRYALSEDGRLDVADRTRFRLRRAGVTVQARVRLRLRFFESGGHKVSGSWSIRAVVRRGGQRIDTCRLRSRFGGGFQSGPA
jgi:hypothetical protein